jgi:hypothetical protein
MVWGVITLLGIFILSPLSAILIYRRWKSATLGVAGGFAIGAVGWLIATMLFWYFQA